MDRKELMQAFNNPTRMGTLATSDGAGKVNNAVFSALYMADEETVLMAIGNNRSFANLQKNPRATFLFFQPAASPYDWQGARVYLKAVATAHEGPVFEQMVGMVRQMAGDRAADNVHAVVTFTIEDARALIDPAV